MTARVAVRRGAFGTLLFVLMAPTAFFFFWMISLSLKTDVDNLAYPPVFIPRSLTLKNYAYVSRAARCRASL
jgi:multiple sugar transport system permease protein